MEKISEIFNNLKERLSNPLLFSFLVSWLVFNWEIAVALFWYDTSQIEAEGCKSIFEFIQYKINEKKTILYPIVFAFLYTFIIPVLKNVVHAFYAWTAKWGESLVLYISKGGKIEMDKFLKLREDYNVKIKQIENVLQEESKYLDENNKILQDLNEAKVQVNTLVSKEIKLKDEINSMSNYHFLNGHWEVTFFDSNSDISSKEIVQISNAKYYVIIKDSKNLKYYITNFNYNPCDKKMLFIKEKRSNDPIKSEVYSNSNLINIFDVQDKNYLRGIENGQRVEYRRMD